MEIAYVTGSDSNFFLLSGILLQSFQTHCPRNKLWVCDFGLQNRQRDIFAKHNLLLPRPSQLPDNLHPWLCKASLVHYLAPLKPDIVVWIDSDCFVAGPLAEQVNKEIEAWHGQKDKIAICQGSVGKFWKRASPAETINHYAMDPNTPYYNSGVWILKSPEVLQQWPETVASAPKTGMFEQDAFNYLLKKNNVTITQLSNEQWNVTHQGLNQLNINSSGDIIINNHNTLIIHLTGDYVPLKVTIGEFTGVIRTIQNDQIRQHQLNLLKTWVESLK